MDLQHFSICWVWGHSSDNGDILTFNLCYSVIWFLQLFPNTSKYVMYKVGLLVTDGGPMWQADTATHLFILHFLFKTNTGNFREHGFFSAHPCYLTHRDNRPICEQPDDAMHANSKHHTNDMKEKLLLGFIYRENWWIAEQKVVLRS